MAKPLVWSERESGDWEACVAASYLIGLVYGGVTAFPLGIYTQAEREALELVPDEPQDYATTDARALARYGVQLRKLSTGSIADAVTRVGVGLVCTGYGGLLIATEASIHSLFYLPTSATAGLVYDPLAVNKTAGVAISASQVVTWTAGRAGPNDIREVRENELIPGAEAMTVVTITPYPAPRTAEIAAGATVDGWNATTLVVHQTFAAGSSFPVDADVLIDQEPAKAPEGRFYRGSAGIYAGLYVPQPQVALAPAPEPPEPPPGNAAEWEAWFAERPKSSMETWLEAAPEEDISG